jgi:hypothetical protein
LDGSEVLGDFKLVFPVEKGSRFIVSFQKIQNEISLIDFVLPISVCDQQG